MAVWKLKRVGPVSSATGEPLAPDTEIVTALFGQEQDEETEGSVRGLGFIRKDFLPEEATDEALSGAFCTWHTRTPPEKPEKEKRFDLEMAREFLERMLREGRDDRASVCLTLALLLARKRRLMIVNQGVDHLEAHWPKDKTLFRIPAPEVSEAEAVTLQQDLMRLFDLEVNASVPAAAEGETTEGTEADPAEPDTADAPEPQATEAEAASDSSAGEPKPSA